MTALQEHQTTRSLSRTRKQSAWQKQREEERQLWIAQHRRIGRITLTGNERFDRQSYLMEYRCDCGTVAWARWSDLKNDVGSSIRSCKNCSQKIRMAEVSKTEEWKAHQRKMCEAALGKPLPSYTAEEHEVLAIMRGAQQRCTRGLPCYKDYNGRGIKFEFPSPEEAMRWVIDNLGPRPSKEYSIDRIDNNGNYTAGNLRWATRQEQNLNKRAYKVGPVGDRIRRLQSKVDYSYEAIRSFIKQGLSDEEIISRKKWDGCGKYQTPRVRHTKRRES